MTDADDGNDWIEGSLQRMKATLDARAASSLNTLGPFEDGRNTISPVELAQLGVHLRHIPLLLNSRLRQKTSSVLAAANFCIDKECWCLILAGETEVGKTLAAEWALSQPRRNSSKTFRTRSQRIFTAPYLRRAWFEQSLMQAMVSAQAMALDDLGSEPNDGSGFTKASLFEVINRRWGRRYKTILTTNLNPQGFRDRYGGRIVERIAQGGRIVVVKGRSMRRPWPHSTGPLNAE